MTDRTAGSFLYEHCDVPEGVPLSQWRERSKPDQRRAQLTSGIVAAIATLAPIVLSVRGSRRR